MNLQYDITVVGANQIRSVIRGVEAEILASNKRMTAGIRAESGGRPRALGAGGAAGEVKALARVRMSEDEKVARAKERLHAKFVSFESREIERITRQRLAGFEKERAARTKLAESMSKGIGTAVRGVARTAAMGATLIGGALIGSALYDQTKVQKGASRVAIQGSHPELKGDIAKQAQNIRGFTGEEALSGLDQFVQKSGDLKAGIDAWKMMGDVSLATSSDITEVGEAAGSAFNLISQSTKDPVERLKLLKDVMENLAVQGNIGSVEMRDFAKELPALAAAARKFGGGGDMLKMMGALTQLAVKRGGATDSAEAATAVNRFADDLVTDAKTTKKHKGLKVFTDKTNTTLRNPAEIIGDVMDQTGGDLTKISALFGVRGRRALSGVAPAYLDAFNAAEKQKPGTGKAAGRAAVGAALGEFTGASLGKQGLDDRVNLRMQDADVQFEEATKSFNRAIGEQLLPAVTKLIPKFVELVPAVTYLTGELVKFVGWLAQNPYEGIGALVLGKVAADIALAGIGTGISKLLTGIIASAIPGATGGIVGPAAAGVANAVGPAATGVTSGLGLAGGAIVGGVAAAGAAVAYGAYALDKQTEGIDKTYDAMGMPVAEDMNKSADEQRAEKRQQQAPGVDSKAAGDLLAAQQKSAADLTAAAGKLSEAAGKLASNDPARSKPIVAR